MPTTTTTEEWVKQMSFVLKKMGFEIDDNIDFVDLLLLYTDLKDYFPYIDNMYDKYFNLR